MKYIFFTCFHLLFLCVLSKAQAQMTPDLTLPNNSTITLDGNTRIIEGGTQVGNNLFHSFKDFSVPTGTSLHFKNGLDVQNIITRITGGSTSNIDGLISANSTANLFLINPSGIVFGANARLDIGGSFLATTAESLEFPNGSFSATNAQAPLLTIDIPIGLRFGNTPGNINISGDGKGARQNSELVDTNSALRVQSNQTLAFVGGHLELSGATLKTAGGQIALGSVVPDSSVSLTTTDKGWNLAYSGTAFGDIQLYQAAIVDASGNGGGNIHVQARNLILSGGSQIESSTLGTEPGGTVIINASESINVLGLPEVDAFDNTNIATDVYEEATGTGGSITIQTRQLTVQDEAQVSSSTSGVGDAGNISIFANAVTISGKTIATDTPFGSSIATVVEPGATGKGGNIIIETGQLVVKDGAALSVSAYSQGNGGNLTIKATDFVNLVGKSPNEGDLSFSSISALSWGSGDAGNVSIQTGRLTVQGGARINLSSEIPPFDIGIDNAGTGNAGILQITANKVDLENSPITAASSGGEGGNIFLRSDNLQLRNSSIATNTLNNGNGGNINIDANTLVAQNSSITANAFQGRGGNIKINTQGLFLSTNSKITATSEQGVNGSVKINTSQLDFDFSGIKASTFDPTEIRNTCSPEPPNQTELLSITGKGGIPRNPSDILDATVGWTGESAESILTPSTLIDKSNQIENQTIVSAQGWKNNGDGTISFTVTPNDLTISNPLLDPPCNFKDSDES